MADIENYVKKLLFSCKTGVVAKKGRSRMIDIGKIEKTQLICIGLFCLALSCFDQKANAQQPATKSGAVAQPIDRNLAKKPVFARPSSVLLGRSLGMSAGILGIGGVILLVHRLISRNPQGRSLQRMNVNELTRGEVLQRIMLNSRQSVYVLRIGGRVMVVGTGSQDAPQLLSEWPVEDTTGDQSAETDDLSDQELPRIIGREESVA